MPCYKHGIRHLCMECEHGSLSPEELPCAECFDQAPRPRKCHWKPREG